MMTLIPEIYVNRYKRSVQCPGYAGSILRQGFNGTERYSGMGDCILLDFHKGFFAVADGSARQSRASRDFLVRLAEGLQNMDFIRGVTDKISDARRLSELLRAETEKIISTVHYTENCTFTGILLVNTEEGRKAIVMHAGDSMLFKYSKDNKIGQLTENNFWFIGRSEKLYQVELLDIYPGEKLFLTTDGFSDLNFSDISCISHIFNEEVHVVPDIILERYETHRELYDDIAMISVDPNFNTQCYGIVIAGGTDKKEEELYYSMRCAGKYDDRYFPLNGKETNSILLI